MTEQQSEYRNQLIDGQLKISIELDKKIVWLSAGAIALSITFMGEILDNEHLKQEGVLIASWSTMILVLILALVNNMLGAIAYMDMRKKFDEALEDNSLDVGESMYKSIIIWINAINIFLISISLLLLIIFTYNNLL
ncbi:MAG: hypothetical protein AAGC45_14325 [Bacteroidota bacterium]